MVSLELQDIQGNILRGYGFPHAVFLFYQVPDPGSGRAFLGDLVDGLRDAEPWGPVPPATATNVAITHAGLRTLGVAGTVLDELPAAFREPIRERAARLLDDTGESGRRHWVDGLGTDRSHILVTVNGSAGCEGAFEAATGDVEDCAARRGLSLVHRQQAESLPSRREHFGWADGFAQPAIEGTPGKPGDGVPQDRNSWRALKAGEFIHGYPDEDDQTISGASASLLRNGTYMVYRKLYQNVARFRNQLYEDAQQYGKAMDPDPPLDPDQLYELMAAKVVGRWRDGLPIELSDTFGGGIPRRTEDNSRKLGDRAMPEPSNDFRYWGDQSGFTCPKGAHIRRTNPRDALGLEEGDGRMSLRHRIIRRGMPYGPFMPFQEGLKGQVDDGEDRGLIFVCFNASLDRQFETIQRQWCNDGNAFHLGNDKDYLLGGNSAPPDAPPGDGRVSSGRFIIQGQLPRFLPPQPPVVLTRGCEYLLVPGITAIRALANGELDGHGETAVPREAEALAQVVALAETKLKRDYASKRPVLRDQHPKAHGCVRAEFVVAEGVPTNLRHGVLAEPRVYPAWIRFSSSSATPQPDSKRDAHGMAIKLMGVEGDKVLTSERDAKTQDFILANSKVFFCRNAWDYVELATRMSEGKLLKFFFGSNPTRWRLREFVNMLVATQRTVHNPLQLQYWSQTPSALGPHAVKYSARPQSETTDTKTASQGDDYLEAAMQHQLAPGSAETCFDFMVQLRTNPTTMPVEDPTAHWKEAASPFVTVATIRIPPQEFTSPARKTFAENLSFTPWHTLPAHRPLGGINRVRRVVYEAISTLRHDQNGVPRLEPTGMELL